MENASNPAREASAPAPTIDVNATIARMRAAGHDHLVHYAGAAHRDLVAWHMCAAYLADPRGDESTLKSRALKAAWGWDVSPDDIRAAHRELQWIPVVHDGGAQ